MKLKDKVALVTGAGQGMGRAIARQFAAEGAIVVALDLNLEAAQQTLQGCGEQHLARALNVADAAAVNALVDEVLALCGMAGGYWALALSTALCYLLGMLAFASALRHYKAPAAT